MGVAVPGGLKHLQAVVGVLYGGGADGVQVGRDEIIPEGVAVQHHGRAELGGVVAAGGVQGEQELQGVAGGLGAVLEAFGQQAAAHVGAGGRVEEVEPGAGGVGQIALQRGAGVGGVQRQRHHAQVAHVGGKVVVARPAHLQAVGCQHGIIDHADGFGVMVAVLDDLVAPAGEDGVDLRLVCGRERVVDPVHGQGERLAVPAQAVGILGEEDRVAEGRIDGRCGIAGAEVGALGGGTQRGRIHDVHEQAAGAPGVVRPRRRRGVDQRHEGEQLGVRLGGIFGVGALAAVFGGDAALRPCPVWRVPPRAPGRRRRAGWPPSPTRAAG